MTEDGEQWVEKFAEENRPAGAEGMHMLSSFTAEFWIRAFCDEVEQRGKYGDRPLAISASFEELKNELLGDS